MINNSSLFKIQELESVEKPILKGKRREILKPNTTRITKGFRVEVEKAHKWDILVAEMKGAKEKKTSPELIDEALDYIFDKYHPINRLKV